MLRRSGWILVALSLGINACQDTDTNNQADPMVGFTGLQLYNEPHTDGNSFACESCHALSEPAEDAVRRAGHQIGDASNRSSFKNGQISSLLAAVNSCRNEWMNAPSFTENQTAWKTLEAYLAMQAEGKGNALISYEIVAPAADLTGGDSVEGMKIFNGSCSICHGTNAVGTIRAPALVGTTLTRAVMAARIRTSGQSDSPVYDNLTGGRMPFFSKERLSDAEIVHLLAYLESTEPASTDTVGNTEAVDISLTNAVQNCSSTHPSVGKSLTFSTKYHQVAGTATVLNDCTIQFSNFSFDGQGIDVRVYTGVAGDFSNGQSISKDLLGTAFDKGTATLRLPATISLDDFDSLSIWCVPVGLSFGDGVFM